jgi:hypothetical protein
MHRAAAIVLTMLIAGCGALQELEPRGAEPWVGADEPRPKTDTESLLVYFEYTKRLAPTELAREQEAARVAFARSRSDFNRVRYAIALAFPLPGRAEAPRSGDLLEPLVKNPQARLHPLAAALATLIAESRRLDAQAAALQQKLDGLRQIEKSLIEREQAGGRKP